MFYTIFYSRECFFVTVKLFQFLATNQSLCVTHITLQEYISQEESSISFIIIVVVVVVVVVVLVIVVCCV